MFGFGHGPELLVFLVIGFLILGPSKLPEVAGMIGRGLRELRKASSELQGTFNVNDLMNPMPPANSPGPEAVPGTMLDQPSALQPVADHVIMPEDTASSVAPAPGEAATVTAPVAPVFEPTAASSEPVHEPAAAAVPAPSDPALAPNDQAAAAEVVKPKRVRRKKADVAAPDGSIEIPEPVAAVPPEEIDAAIPPEKPVRPRRTRRAPATTIATETTAQVE